MTNYFPADVSLRVEGDLGDAQKLFPKAANILYKALELQRNGDKQNVSLTAPGTDGSVINVFLSGRLKHVYVQPAVRVGVEEKKPEFVVPPPPPVLYFLDMYSGVVCPASGTGEALTVDITDPDPPHGTVTALDSFFPEATSAAANNLDLAWQQPKKLGVNSAGAVDGGGGDSANSALPKPGMYSGAMTRLVSALLGCGRESPTYTPSYITGIVPAEAPDEVAWNRYDYAFLKTNGIFKDQTTGVIWLIDISKDNGVLAMRLPTFDGTDSYEFFQYLATIGDGGTLSVIAEFGGLPTGEPFPTGTDLTDALSAGLVIQLADATALANAYHDATNDVDKASLYSDCGWAFSDTGAKADNVVFWYEDISVIELAYFGGSEASNQRFMHAQHWSISIDIDTANNTGSASLTEIEDKLIFNSNNLSHFDPGPLEGEGDAYTTTMIQAPNNGVDSTLFQVTQFGKPNSGDVPADFGEAPMFVFYLGEAAQVVRRSVPVSMWFAYQAAFYGPQIDLGPAAIVDLGGGHNDYYMGGLVIPAFCREAYVLVRGHINSFDTYNPAIPTVGVHVAQQGYFKNYGIVDFSPIDSSVSSFIDGLGDWILYYGSGNWFSVWALYYAFGGVHVIKPVYKFGASVNTGPTPGYVMHDGIDAAGETAVIKSGSMSDYSLPDGAKPGSVTFIGSV